MAERAERRNAERTQEAILVAAEELFARLGFDGASVQQIAESAGVARSTPSYFFGSKEALYDAVLERVVTRGQQAMARAYAEAAHGGSATDAIDAYVAALVDFLGDDRNFLHLIQREALGDGSRVTAFFALGVDEAVAMLRPVAEEAGIPAERLILDLTALCWYPFAHEHTLLPALGIDARDPAFIAEQKRHVGDLTRALTRRTQPGAP